MGLITSPENEFISELEVYFDTKFDKYTHNRITKYLVEYKNKIPAPSPIIINKDKVVYRQLKTRDIITPQTIDDNTPTTQEVLNVVMEGTNLPKKLIIGTSREAHLITARHVAIYVMRDLCGETLMNIGKIFNRDHTTVLYSIQHVMKMIELQDYHYVKLLGFVNYHLQNKDEKKTA